MKPSSENDTEGNGDAHNLVRTNKDLGQFERDIAHYPEEIRIEAHWLQGFFLNHCSSNIHSLRSIATKLGHDRSASYFMNLINGDQFTNKPSSWVPGGKAWLDFLDIIEGLRRYDQQASRTGRIEFIETDTYRLIADFITAKRALSAVCKIGGIVAPTGGQTSESFKYICSLNNHGQMIHVEAPASGKLTELEIKIAEAYHVLYTKIAHRAGTRRMAIRENVNETRCIIIDNCQVLYDPGRKMQQPAFNWIRELYDDKRPTFILKFTQEFFDDHLIADAARSYFEQFIGRMGGLQSILKLPSYAPKSDLRTIGRAYGLTAEGALEYLQKWSRMPGRIRIVFDRLQYAREFARIDGRNRITIDDLAEADEYTPSSLVLAERKR